MQKSLNFKEHWDKEYESVSLINGKSAFHFNNVLNVEPLIVISYLKTVLNPSCFPFSLSLWPILMPTHSTPQNRYFSVEILKTFPVQKCPQLNTFFLNLGFKRNIVVAKREQR